MHHNFFAIGNKPSELLKSNSTGGAVQAPYRASYESNS